MTKKVSLWVRAGAKQGWALQFKDGWNRSEGEGGKLEWNLAQGADGTWKKMTFAVPPNWVQPISIDGVLAHNWDNKTEKASAHLSLDQLQVETDLSDVDDETGVLKTWKAPGSPANPTAAQNAPTTAPVTPLLKVDLRAGELHNVFCGVPAQFLLTAQNWRAAAAAAAAAGNLQWKLVDANGQTLKTGEQAIKVEDNFALRLPLQASRFGVYRFESTIVWANGKKIPASQSFAVIPRPRELSEAEKDASPYGLNVLSARQPMVATFRKAGITWFRDYGFNFEWMQRARGEDNKYGGWPWYPKIVREYQDNGARVLANLQTSIKPPVAGAPPEPNLAWVREMVGIQTAFPFLRTFELDNEYDLNAAHAKAEETVSWKNYGNYHKKFAEIAHLLSNGQFMAVENGRAGIWPQRVRRMIASGDFAAVDVINSHHYAGADAPELNAINHNMGFSGDEQVMSLFDQLQAVKKAGSSDGKPRQHWLSEFGWDTKAGPIVSASEQAAYLQRAFMLFAAAGTEKGFWYFNLDSPGANQFFDGCGLFTFDQQPKLSYAAFAGLTQILPRPQFIGTINAGENTWGYLFRNDGKLVAALWSLNGDKGPRVDFGNAALFDEFANPLQEKTVELGIAPVYAVGVDEKSRWVEQANYSLESPHLVTATAGDSLTATLRVHNTRASAINGKVRLQLPAGWTDAGGEKTVAVAAGKTADISLTFRIANEENLGEKQVGIAVSEGQPLHTIPLHVQIGRPIVMSVARGLGSAAGESEGSVRITNRSSQPLDGTLRLKLPAGWKTQTPEIKVAALKPMEVREVPFKVLWTPNWKENESATSEYQSADGRSAQQPLIPGRLTFYAAPNLKMDGDLKDWPAKTRLPNWILGSTLGEAKAAVHLAWSEKGLAVALDVRDSKVAVPDPRSFWLGDVLELFIDTRDKKTARAYEAGDHQFWLAPQIEQKRVYVGQWKRNAEIPATIFDLPGIQSATLRKVDGYVSECLIPAAMLKDFKPAAGTHLGLNLNLSVKGVAQDREVFWPNAKADSTEQPATWGTITLAN